MSDSIFNPSTGSKCDYVEGTKCAVYTGYTNEIVELSIFSLIAWRSYIDNKSKAFSHNCIPAIVLFTIAPAYILGELLVKFSNNGYVFEPITASNKTVQAYSNITINSHKDYGTKEFNLSMAEFSQLQQQCFKDNTCTRVVPPPPIAASNWHTIDQAIEKPLVGEINLNVTLPLQH